MKAIRWFLVAALLAGASFGAVPAGAGNRAEEGWTKLAAPW